MIREIPRSDFRPSPANKGLLDGKMVSKATVSDARPLATTQGWFSWNTWGTLFVNVFDNISSTFLGDSKPLVSVAPLPETVSPETLIQYLAIEFTPKLSLAERAIQHKNSREAGRVVAVLEIMKERVEQAIKVVNHYDYHLVHAELAKVGVLAKKIVRIIPKYPTVPKVAPDRRIHPSFGLHNPHNNCFINTALQTVFSNPLLVEHIVYGEGQHLVVRELYQEYKRLQEAGTFHSNPDFASPLREICPQFSGSGQHDAIEFLLRVLIDPLKNTKDLPFFFELQERSYYHGYEDHQADLAGAFEADGSRMRSDIHSSLQLSIPPTAKFPSLEELIRFTCSEVVEQDPTDAGVEFLRKGTQKPVRMKLARKVMKMRCPSCIFVDIKRHSVVAQEFSGGNGAFKGARNSVEIAFDKVWFIPPEHDIDGKGAKYVFVSLVNGGGFYGGHYVATVEAHNAKRYQYSDSSRSERSETEFNADGKALYGGFALRVPCEDVQAEMEEHIRKSQTDKEIGTASSGKWGAEKELSLIALFNQYLGEKAPNLGKLQKVYDQLSPEFQRFVAGFFPESPRDHLVELREITDPLLIPAKASTVAEVMSPESVSKLLDEDTALRREEVEVATHIVAQYEQVRKQNLALAKDHRNQLAMAQLESERLAHLSSLGGKQQLMVAAILDPGLEKVIQVRGLPTLISENQMELEVLRGKQLNQEIRSRPVTI